MTEDPINATEVNPPKKRFWRGLLKFIYIMLGTVLCGVLLVAITVIITWPKLPELEAMRDYRPRVPLRVYTSDHVLLAEFGEERRDVVPIQEIPQVLIDALLAAEDDDFYQHGGVDWMGVARAVIINVLKGSKTQGASTITMQVARNFYLSSKKTYIRKFYEILLTYKIEHELTKSEILELYMNQIYLGHRSYGFSAAAKTYFGVSLDQLTLAQAAMLAGIPKAPSRVNPITGPAGARQRQLYVLRRMLELGKITKYQYDKAIAEPIVLAKEKNVSESQDKIRKQGRYVAELARQLMFDIYGDDVYSRGLDVYLTISSKDQDLAYQAVHQGVMNYTKRQPFAGAVAQLRIAKDLEKDPEAFESVLEHMQKLYRDKDEFQSFLVLSATPKKVLVARQNDQIVSLTGDSLTVAQKALGMAMPYNERIRRGSIIYVKNTETGLKIVNPPEVEAAFVAVNPQNGAILAMVGGFASEDKFNRVTQAWRQPGSTFKPFIYAAALERGITPQTQVSDQPFYSRTPSGELWLPRNYGNRYEEHMTMRQGLYRSRNMVSIRILQTVGPDFATDFIRRFGFDPRRQPSKHAYLTMALGAGSVTPLQMAMAYAVFANGGYRVQPYLIDHVIDSTNNSPLMQADPDEAGNENNRILDPRTAYIMQSLLKGVARSGTAARAYAELKRKDIAGKTGTTNNSNDAWFAGFTPKMVGIAWLGFDSPHSLGDRETGGGAAMPIWLDFMKGALEDEPVEPAPKMPAGLTQDGERFWYSEFPPGEYISEVAAGDSIPDDEVLLEKEEQEESRGQYTIE